MSPAVEPDAFPEDEAAINAAEWVQVTQALQIQPATAAALDGLSFSKAFQQFVLDDPAVVAAGKRDASEGCDCGDVFKTGELPKFGYRWPIKLGVDDLISAFTYCPITVIGGYQPSVPPPSASLCAAAAVLADRWDALITFFRRGEAVAVDMNDSPLGKGVWHRSGTAVDVQNSDLFDGDNDKPLRRGLMLRCVELAVEASPITSIAPKAGTGAPVLLDMSKLPKSLQSIHVAVMALWEGKIPDLLRAQQRDKQILDYLKKCSDLSTVSPSSIKRYMREYKKAVDRPLAPRAGALPEI